MKRLQLLQFCLLAGVSLAAVSFSSSSTTCPPPVPVDGGWGSWSAWSACDWLSGCCEQTRTRECNNPAPANRGARCVGPDVQSRDEQSGSGVSLCGQGEPVNGNWSQWSPWSACSVTAGDGYRTRVRICNSPAPSNGGQGCCHLEDNSSVQVEECYVEPPPQAMWGPWGEWSDCDVACGGGVQSRERACITERCGLTCEEGEATETRTCNPSACVNDGKARCYWDGALGKPHIFHFGWSRTEILIPCQHKLLSLIVNASAATSNQRLNVECWASNWQTTIQNRYFVYALRCTVTYFTATDTTPLGVETFYADTMTIFGSTPVNNFIKTTSGTITSVTTTSFLANKDQLTLNVASGAILLEYVPIEPDSSAIRGGAKPAVRIEAKKSAVSDAPDSQFPQTVCGRLAEQSIKQYARDEGLHQLAMGVWAVLEQDGPQTFGVPDPQCASILGTYATVCNATQQTVATDNCYHILTNPQNVGCVQDNLNLNAFHDVFKTCLDMVCDPSANVRLAACQSLSTWKDTCVSLGVNTLDLSLCEGP